VIDPGLFTGIDDISGTDLVNGEIVNVADSVNSALKNFGWNGKAIGCLILELSQDNSEVTNAQFSVRGDFGEKELQIGASKLWQDANVDTVLTIRFPRPEAFVFPEGLWSNMLEDSKTVHYYHMVKEGRAPQPINDADLEKWGIGRFCLQMVCCLSAASSVETGPVIKYKVLLFPTSKEKISEMGMVAKSAGLPGLKAWEGECPLGPRPQQAWRCPLAPLLLTGTPFEQLAESPGVEQLRYAIGRLMIRAAQPEICKNVSSLANKWEKIKKGGGIGSVKDPPLRWPDPGQRPVRTGKHYHYLVA